MTFKRKRRTVAQSSGLAVGETLKRSILAGRDYSAWGWVSEVSDASEISHDHLLRTCGFSPNFLPKTCPNKYAKPDETSTKSATEQQPVDEGLDDDCVIVADDGVPLCNKGLCQSNPYCLNYLGQQRWEDYEEAKNAYMKLVHLGKNPVSRAREPGHPVGLKNLGATCYANAFLQVWFQDLSFRSGVYRCQPHPDQEHKFEESPIFQLQVTFAALQEGTQNVFNPVKLVESLKLRTTEQQDAQEFSKLFMSHLDSEFQKQHNPDLKSLVAHQFQGKQVYGTICANCESRSERVSDFLEIEVSIDKNNAKLEDRVNASLNPETLTGDNKYFCSQCDSLQDATRYTTYTEFPPVLHFSLLRFVYDLASMERKKSKHLISFPLHLNMSQFLRPQGHDPKEQIYDLRGILLHKGVSAYHGHYEAQVFDVSTVSWYQYNDEIVTKMESLGAKLTEVDVIDVDADEDRTTKKKPLAQARRKRRRVEDSDDETGESSKYVSSKEAYMLIYVRRGDKIEASFSSSTPPARALGVVNSLNGEHDRECDEYARRKNDATSHFDCFRRQVMSIYQTWASSSTSKSVVVSKKALETFLTRNPTWSPVGDESNGAPNYSSSPHPDCSITNDKVRDKREASKPGTKDIETPPTDSPHEFSIPEIVCEHGSLDPSKAMDMKCITRAACENISSYGREIFPILTTDDVCEKCVAKIFEEKSYQIEHPRLVSSFDEVCDVEEGLLAFWISKPWLKDWRLAKPKMHVQAQEDPSPDFADFSGHVRCEHGSLSPNATFRRRISPEAAHIIQILFPSWNPPSTEEEICAICEALIHVSKEGKREVRKRAEDEKARLKHMYENGLSGNAAFLENIPCCIIPTKFLRDWKQWLLKPTEVIRPQSVSTGELICDHGLLALDPNSASDLDSSVTLITRSDWEILADLYQTDSMITVERHSTDAGRSFFVLDNGVCQECRHRRKAEFESTEVTIRILGPSDPIPSTDSFLNCPDPNDNDAVVFKYGSTNGGGVRRQSKRLRQGKGRKQTGKILVWKSTTVIDIKNQVQEELNIPRMYQTLFYQGKELDNDEQSVEDIGIMLNDFLDVRQDAEDVDMYDNDDDDSPLPTKRRRREEGVEGFRGTLLGGFATDSSADDRDVDGIYPPESSSPPVAEMKPCPVCTFANVVEDAFCGVCEHEFL